jgi:hypothetical protein
MVMKEIDSLLGSGWINTMLPAPARIIASIEGTDKTGKTHLALTAPRPIMYIDLDVGTEGVIHKFQGEDLMVYQVQQPERLGSSQELMGRYGEIWATVQDKISEALAMNEGTLIIDTFTEAYDICRLAHFGKMSQVQPHQYGVAYADLREVMRKVHQSKMSCILLHKMGNNFNTGEPEMKGWNDIPHQVQVTLRTDREDTADGPVFLAEVRACRQNPNLMGKHLYAGATTDPRGIPGGLNMQMLLSLVQST